MRNIKLQSQENKQTPHKVTYTWQFDPFKIKSLTKESLPNGLSGEQSRCEAVVR